MAIRVALQHRTTYRFDRQVNLSPHEIRLRPAPHCRTPVLGYSLNVTPDRYFLNWQQDPYGNWVARLVFTAPTEMLDIVVDLTADMTVTNPFDFFVEPYAEHYPFVYAPALAKELIPFLETAPAARTTVQSPQRWTDDAEWKKDFNDLSKLSPEKIAERRKEFEVVKAVAKTKREGT